MVLSVCPFTIMMAAIYGTCMPMGVADLVVEFSNWRCRIVYVSRLSFTVVYICLIILPIYVIWYMHLQLNDLYTIGNFMMETITYQKDCQIFVSITLRDFGLLPTKEF
jgi:hypothetical protein